MRRLRSSGRSLSLRCRESQAFLQGCGAQCRPGQRQRTGGLVEVGCPGHTGRPSWRLAPGKVHVVVGSTRGAVAGARPGAGEHGFLFRQEGGTDRASSVMAKRAARGRGPIQQPGGFAVSRPGCPASRLQASVTFVALSLALCPCALMGRLPRSQAVSCSSLYVPTFCPLHGVPRLLCPREPWL